MLRSFFLGFFVLLATGLSTWTYLTLNKPPAFVATNSNDEPNILMEGVVATIMNKEGTPALKLETPKMEHHAENDVTEIETPHVTVYRDSPQPWYIDSRHARTSQGANEITFWENVVIRHIADTNNPKTTMLTRSLTIIPDKKVAQTDAAVLITQPSFTIHAVGMLANLNEGTIKLLSKAREEYVPKS